MSLLQELSLDTYEQFATGRKVMQLGSNEVKTYNSTIPKLPVFSLLELHQFMRKVRRVHFMLHLVFSVIRFYVQLTFLRHFRR